MNLITSNLVAIVSQLFPDALFYKPTLSKVVALTIDDVGGMETIKILDAIDRFNQNVSQESEKVRATFFVISEKIENSMIIDEILNRGHEIGNHGEKDHFPAFLYFEQFETEIKQTHEKLSSNKIKPEIKWFRPGRALYNENMLQTLKAMAGYQNKFALASMVPLDTFPIINSPDFTIQYISQFIFPGSILLLHGGFAEITANTVAVLEQLLPKLQAQEYKVVTLSELLRYD